MTLMGILLQVFTNKTKHYDKNINGATRKAKGSKKLQKTTFISKLHVSPVEEWHEGLN